MMVPSKAVPKAGRVLFTKKAIKLLATMDPKKVIKVLNRSLGYSKTPASTQEVLDLIDASGLSRLVFAMFGSKKTASRLGIDPELVNRLVRAYPSLQLNGTLILEGDLNIRGLKQLVIPDVVEVEGRIEAASTAFISLPDLRIVGRTINASNSESFSATSLEVVHGRLDGSFSRELNFPSLCEVKGDVGATLAQSMLVPSLRLAGGLQSFGLMEASLPALEALGEEGLQLIDNKALTFPNLELIAGKVTLINGKDLSFPKLRQISGAIRTERCPGLAMPLLEAT